jgi:hypothetical protein
VGPSRRAAPPGRLDQRGRLAERRALGGAAAAPAVLVRDAMIGALPPAAGDAAAAAWLAGDDPWADPQPLVWLAERGDSAGLRRYLARAERLAPGADAGTGEDEANRDRTRAARLARAYLALARRDTAGALALLRQVTPRDCPVQCLANDLLRVRLLRATGAEEDARALLASGSPGDWSARPTAFDVLWLLERARAAERAGEAARAAADYRSVAGFWSRADAPLQPLAAEARAGLGRALTELRRRPLRQPR